MYLDDILIYTEDDGDGHVAAVRWVLEQLRKFSLYANLKKCRFHQDEVRFLGYVVSSKGIRMEDKRIKAVKQWPEPQSVWDNQVFLGFAKFYRWFIQGFSRIAAPLTSMLKTVELKKGGDGVGGDSRVKRDGIDKSGMDNIEVGGGEVEVDEVGKKGRKMSKSKKLFKSEIVGLDFLTPGAKLAFTKLRQAFFNAPILNHFDLERHIQIETDVSGHAIDGVLSQLTSDDLGRWHPVAFFSRKMILAETRYKTHCDDPQPYYSLLHIRDDPQLLSIMCQSCYGYVEFCVVRLGQQKTIYFFYFVPRFLFSLSTFLDFIYLPKSNSFLWGLDII